MTNSELTRRVEEQNEPVPVSPASFYHISLIHLGSIQHVFNFLFAINILTRL